MIILRHLERSKLERESWGHQTRRLVKALIAIAYIISLKYLAVKHRRRRCARHSANEEAPA